MINAHKFLRQLRWEIKIMCHEHGYLKTIASFAYFAVASISLLGSPAYSNKLGAIIFVASAPLALIGSFKQILYQDVQDGSVEIILSKNSVVRTILAKWLALYLISIAALICCLPLLLMLNVTLKQCMLLIPSIILMLGCASGLFILLSAVQSYFPYNVSYLGAFILLFLFPSFALLGIILRSAGDLWYLLYMLLAIGMIITPITLSLSAWLINNLYNN